MPEVKVSVIIPVYNTEKYLKKCLDSIVNQTLKDIEIICVDDGSKDSSLQILNEYSKIDNRIKIITQENSGAAIARNKGVDAAKGEYLYFIDSDDYVDYSFLEKMYSQISCTDSDICLCERTDYDELRDKYYVVPDAINTKMLPAKVFNVDYISDKIFQICTIGLISKIFNRNFIVSNNIKFQNLSSCNDVLFYFITLVLAKKITYVEESLVTSVRCRNGSISSKRGNKINNILYAVQQTKEYLEELELFTKVEHSFYMRLANNFYYELSQCSDNELKKEFNYRVKNVLPFKYLLIYKKYCLISILKMILNFVFSITNVYENNIKYKKIVVFGMSYKLRRNKK